ncbi:MAG TPA: four helix bundle protein [Pyrinomonadaceae bacterium]|nr:four helix bundle protein [Pyrinomonadaceae bacterium]
MPLRKETLICDPHEKLDVWKRAIDFVVAVYKMTESFPRDERFGLISQIRRAAVSVPANIAEGAARHSSKEFKYFLSNAQGSVSELATELLIAQRLGYLNEQSFNMRNDELTSIGRMILGLSRSVNRDP